jgi:hypothetical protein
VKSSASWVSFCLYVRRLAWGGWTHRGSPSIDQGGFDRGDLDRIAVHYDITFPFLKHLLKYLKTQERI